MPNTITINQALPRSDGSSWNRVVQRASLEEAEEIYAVGVTDGRHIGRNEGVDRMHAVIQSKLHENMESAAEFSLQILETLKGKGFSAKGVRMCTDGIFDFDVLFIISLEDHLSPSFLKVYDKVWEIENEFAGTTFNPHAQFLAIEDGENWNEDALIGDGYAYSLEKLKTS